jgi:hypothetical protein
LNKLIGGRGAFEVDTVRLAAKVTRDEQSELWETTAVPELRAQALQLAQALLTDDRSHLPAWAQETPADLLEYYI